MKIKFTHKHKHVLIINGTQGMAMLSLAVVSRLNKYVKSSVPCARALSRLWARLNMLGHRASSISCARVLGLLGVLLIAGASFASMLQLSTGSVQAATSNTLNFQGRLLTNTGALVPDGTYNVQFNLYYVSTGGSSQWTETRTNQGANPVTIANGYYSVYLGDITAFPSSIDWSQDLYLGMTIRGTGSCAFGACTPTDSEMTPRFKLTAVPYALRAANVASSDTNAASTNTDNVTIETGDALGATSNSGSISLNVGSATGTAGAINIGNGTNAPSSILIGQSGVTTTIQGSVALTGTGTALSVTNDATIGGTLGVTGLITASGGLTVTNGDTLTNAGATLNTAVAISNVAGGGNIGTAAATVDSATTFNVNQTTASQTLTLPAPTVTTAGRIAYVNNVGSASFTMYGSVIGAGQSNAFIWNGSSWVTTVSLSGSVVNVIGTIDSQTKSADGAVISSNAIYLQTADATYPGLVSASAQTFAGAKTLSSDLIVNGNTTIGDAVTDNLTVTAAIQGTSALIFDGSTDDTNETTLSITNPTADRTQTLQDNSGVIPLSTAGNTLFFTTSGATNVTLPTSGTLLSNTLTDNVTDAFDLQEGTNNYININTTNSSEAISLGNTTTNPDFNLLGSGTTNISGAVNITSGTLYVEQTASSFVQTLDYAGGGGNDIALRVRSDAAYAIELLNAAGNQVFSAGQGYVDVGGSSVAGNLSIFDGSSNYTTITSAAQTGNYTLTIPALTGNTSFCLLSNNCGYVSASLTDNIADALDIQEGTNNYININTTNSSENISFGNATTNPSFNFLGTGTLAVAGAQTIGGNLAVDTDTLFVSAASDFVAIGSTSAANSRLNVAENAGAADSGSIIQASGTLGYTTGAGELQYAFKTFSNVTPTTAASGSYFGGVFGPQGTSTSNLTGATIGGVYGLGTYSGSTGTLGTAIGGRFTVFNNSSNSGTITRGIGVQVSDFVVTTLPTATIANRAGIQVDAFETNATNSTLLLLGTNTIPSADYSIYNASTQDNIFAGDLRIGSTTAPTVALDVTGDGLFSGNLTVNGNTTLGDAVTDNLTVTAAIQGTSALIFDGSSNDTNETTLSITNPTADRTQTIQDNSGVIPLGTAGNTLFFTTSGATNVTLPTSGTVTTNPASGSYLLQVPTSTAANTITPTTNSVVGLTVNGTSGTAATAVSIVQGGAATALNVNGTSTGSVLVLQDNGTSVLTVADGGVTTITANGGSGVALTVNNGTSTGSIFIAQDNGSAVLTVADGGNVTLTADLAVNGDDITSDGNLTVNATGYVRIGDTGTPGVASGDDDLYVESDLEVDANTDLAGTLTVGGNTTIGDAVTDNLTITAALQGTSALVFDGSTDDTNETTLSITNPTADRTQTIQDNSGVIPLGTAGNTLFFTTSGATNVTLPTSGTLLSSSLTDNTTDAFDLQEGTNNYININTTNSSENISFGNATTNPSYSFLGTGTVTLTADLAVNGDDITSDGNLTVNATGYVRIGDTGTPGVASGDDDLYVESDLEVDGRIEVTSTYTDSTAAQTLNVTLGNDANVDIISGLQVSVTSATTGDADVIHGVLVEDLVSAGATVLEYGVTIGEGWDAQLYLSDASSKIMFDDGGVLTFADGGDNTLLTVTDAGTVGNVAITGNLAVDTDTLYVDATNNKVVIGGTTHAGYGEKLTVRTSGNSEGIVHTDGTVALSTYVGFSQGYLGTNTNHALVFYANGTDSLGVSNTNIAFVGSGAAGASLATGQGDLIVQGDLEVDGYFNFQNDTDSTTAFQILESSGAGGSSLLTADTTNFLLKVAPTQFTSSGSTQSFAANGSVTGVDSYSTIAVNATVAGVTVTIPSPAAGGQVVGRVLYVAAVNGSEDFVLSLAGTSVEINMKENSTATLIWNGTGWTAAGASSSTDLQAAYDNTAATAGGAEIVLASSGTGGLTIRNDATTAITGGLLEVQTSIGSNLFTVNNNATEYAANGGAESSTFTAWAAAPAGGTVTRYTTTGDNIATGAGSVFVNTTSTVNTGAKNTLTASLTANLRYKVSYTARHTSSTTTFTTLETYFSNDGTTAHVECGSDATIYYNKWTRVDCTFTPTSVGASNAIIFRHTDAVEHDFYIDNFSVTVDASSNHAVDGDVNSALGTNWQAYDADGGAGTSSPVLDNTNIYNTSGAVAVTTAGPAANLGLRNNMAITPSVSTQYLVTFYAKLASGSFTDITVGFLPAGGSSTPNANQLCTDYNTQTLSTSSWTKITCIFTTPSSGISDPDLVIYQPTSGARTFYIDALKITLNTNNSSNVQVGGGQKGGPTTLFTLDRSYGAPIADNNDAYLGSMYYDTSTGRIQCYEADGWGACGAAPDNIVNLNPEYAGAVLNGSGVGTMTADFCSNDAQLSVNSTLCDAGEAKNYYRWTSPQATQQTYSIYVTYQLPATFNGFSSDDTVQLVARTDSTTNAAVTYEMYKSTGSDVSQCGSGETTVVTVANDWQSVGINGNESTGCSFSSSSASNFIIFKINLKANSNANAYVSTLSFTTTGR